MKITFRALLLLSCALFLSSGLLGTGVYAQSGIHPEFEGVWKYTKVEYLERESPSHAFQVKHTVSEEENLYSFEHCYSYLIKEIIFSVKIATVYDLLGKYVGSFQIRELTSSTGNQFEMLYGYNEEIETPIEFEPNVVFNAPGIRYVIEIIDSQTIAMIYENTCNENNVEVYGAVRCVLKRLPD